LKIPNSNIKKSLEKETISISMTMSIRNRKRKMFVRLSEVEVHVKRLYNL